jgi:probable F420-dependent oxidoreductase
MREHALVSQSMVIELWGGRMKIGIFAMLSEQTLDPVSVARRCEELGFESIWVPEHAIIPVHTQVPYPALDGKIPDAYTRFPDPFVLLGMMASVTRILKLGTAICLVPERHPLALAKEVATVDYFSGGRFLFGIGAGWQAEESAIMGVDFARRWSITRDYLRAMKELWTKPEASFDGEFLKFPAVIANPKPAHKPHPPIFIGAGGLNWKRERALKDTVAFGDGWMPVALPPQDLASDLALMKRLCAEAGRDFDKLEITMTFLQQPELQPKDPKRAVEEYAEAGAHRLIVAPVLDRANAERVLERTAKEYLQ